MAKGGVDENPNRGEFVGTARFETTICVVARADNLVFYHKLNSCQSNLSHLSILVFHTFLT